MTPVEIAWVAGLFEGEGSFFVNQIRRKKGPRAGEYQAYPVASLKMTDEDVVRKLTALVGYGRVYYTASAKAGWKPSWTWRIHGTKLVTQFGELILPHLGKRRTETYFRVIAPVTQQAEVAVSKTA